MLLDFSIDGDQDTTFVSLKKESYFQLIDEAKVFVTEDPIYLDFEEVNCIAPSTQTIHIGQVTPEHVQVVLPEVINPQEIIVRIDDIPYEINDVMVSNEN